MLEADGIEVEEDKPKKKKDRDDDDDFFVAESGDELPEGEAPLEVDKVGNIRK